MPRVSELSRQPLDPYTTCSRDSTEEFCGDADLIVAALVLVVEAFRVRLSSERFWCVFPVSVFGRGLDAWTYGQASLEGGANLHKCKVKRVS